MNIKEKFCFVTNEVIVNDLNDLNALTSFVNSFKKLIQEFCNVRVFLKKHHTTPYFIGHSKLVWVYKDSVVIDHDCTTQKGATDMHPDRHTHAINIMPEGLNVQYGYELECKKGDFKKFTINADIRLSTFISCDIRIFMKYYLNELIKTKTFLNTEGFWSLYLREHYRSLTAFYSAVKKRTLRLDTVSLILNVLEVKFEDVEWTLTPKKDMIKTSARMRVSTQPYHLQAGRPISKTKLGQRQRHCRCTICLLTTEA